ILYQALDMNTSFNLLKDHQELASYLYLSSTEKYLLNCGLVPKPPSPRDGNGVVWPCPKLSMAFRASLGRASWPRHSYQ
ncbi:hypothetical protein STEG23_006962, partial [Scotinomys teguina]